MVVEIRGETQSTQSWVDDGQGPRHKPWDGDMGSIQELFYGVSTVKASSYKEAYKMCVRKHVEDAVSKAQMAVNEHERRHQKLASAMHVVQHEYEHLSKACWRLKAEREARERQEILRQVLNRRRDWAELWRALAWRCIDASARPSIHARTCRSSCPFSVFLNPSLMRALVSLPPSTSAWCGNGCGQGSRRVLGTRRIPTTCF